jgi:hypothetical protein
LDTEVLALREQGESFSAIARTLELGRAIEAHRRLVHALSAYKGAERQRLVAREEVRLDELEQRIRDRDAAEPDKIERRILAVDKYREDIRHMTAEATHPGCTLCDEPSAGTIEPSRRTLARGLDPDDESCSVTVILPDVPLCTVHTLEVHQGDVLIGWCDDEVCRKYGEVGEPSSCGDPYHEVGSSNRP